MSHCDFLGVLEVLLIGPDEFSETHESEKPVSVEIQ